MADDLLLLAAKRGEAEHGVEQGEGVHGGVHIRRFGRLRRCTCGIDCVQMPRLASPSMSSRHPGRRGRCGPQVPVQLWRVTEPGVAVVTARLLTCAELCWGSMMARKSTPRKGR